MAETRSRKKLTKTVVEKAKGTARGGKRIADTELIGFFLKVHPSGKKTFGIRYGPRTHRRQCFVGDFPPMTVEDARAAAKLKLAEYQTGHDPAEERKAERNALMFKAWADEYIKSLEGRKKSLRADRLYLRLARERWAHKPLAKVTTADVARFFEDMKTHGKVTANRALASVRACLAAAWRQDKIADNPALKVRPLPEPNPRTRILSADEYKRLVAEVAKLENEHERAAFLVLLGTGCRLSELLHARWEDFDLGNPNRASWRIPSPKAGKPQVQPLTRTLALLLRGLEHEGAFVIPGKKPDAPRFDLKKPWEALRKAAKLEGVTIHDLRRSYGAETARRAGLHVASALLRHSDIRVTQRHYAPLQLDDLRKHAAAVEQGRKATPRKKRAKAPEGGAKVLPMRGKAQGE